MIVIATRSGSIDAQPQSRESDLAFLRRPGREHDAVATVKAGRLILSPIGAATPWPPPPWERAPPPRTRRCWRAATSHRRRGWTLPEPEPEPEPEPKPKPKP